MAKETTDTPVVLEGAYQPAELEESDPSSLGPPPPDEKRNGASSVRLQYTVEQRPPVHLTIVLGLQNLLLSVSSTVSVPIMVSKQVCAGNLPDVEAMLIGTFLVMCGVSTILQCLIGVRLPILQGGSSTFIPPIMAMMALDAWKCPAIALEGNNATALTGWRPLYYANETNINEIWQKPMREIQGSIMLASLTQVVIGGSGLITLLLKVVGPLTVTPTVALIGLSLAPICIELCEHQWGIAMLAMALLFLFALYLNKLKLPVPAFSWKEKCHVQRTNVFQLLSVILTIGITWLFCGVLELSGVLGEDKGSAGYGARTNVKIIQDFRWIYLPYPGQWGLPTISVASYVGMLCATLASIVESIGDYYACARACGISRPPSHAVNRGVMMEGLSSVLAGALGSTGASTSYSDNIGAINITSVASRSVFVTSGILFIACGVFGKFGALMAAMPLPIIGATVTVGLAMVVSVALANLSYVDMNRARNQCILGVSLMMGLMVPQWMNKNSIHTGVMELDQALSVMLGTPMFVGGAIGCLLDNTVPGTLAERGMLVWRERSSGPGTAPVSRDHVTYDIPYISKGLRRFPWLQWLPFIQKLHPESDAGMNRKTDVVIANPTHNSEFTDPAVLLHSFLATCEI